MDELLEITINYLGEDYSCVVDHETANILLNDPDKAREHIEKLFGTQNSETSISSDARASTSTDTSKAYIWSSKRPTETDHEATIYFLKLREKFAAKFDNRKNTKNFLWKLIGEEMSREVYHLGDNSRDIIEKLRQKFANPQKQYVNYIKHVKTTGVQKKDPPPYFDEMHSILKNKDKVNPDHLQDSLNDANNTSEVVQTLENKENEGGESSSDSIRNIKNRFSASRSIKPTSVNKKMLEIIISQHNENREDRKKQLQLLENQLTIQNKQRERILDQFQQFLNMQNRKRKHESDSDDE